MKNNGTPRYHSYGRAAHRRAAASRLNISGSAANTTATRRYRSTCCADTAKVGDAPWSIRVLRTATMGYSDRHLGPQCVIAGIGAFNNIIIIPPRVVCCLYWASTSYDVVGRIALSGRMRALAATAGRGKNTILL